MLVYSIIIRGGGNKIKIKRRRIGFNIHKRGVDICFVLETKIKGMDDGVVKELWGGDNVEWAFSDALGASGGMLIMWKRNLLVPLFSFKNDGYVGIYVEKNDKVIFYVNVYAS